MAQRTRGCSCPGSIPAHTGWFTTISDSELEVSEALLQTTTGTKHAYDTHMNLQMKHSSMK